MRMRIGGYVAFSGDLEPDVDGAAIALRRVGFHVTRMPEKFRPLLAHPDDDFIEVAIDGTDDEKVIDSIMAEINAIVDRYDGLLDECGPIPSNRVPFEELFEALPRWH